MSENMEEVVNNRQYFIRKMTENDISGALQVFTSHGLYEAKHSMKTYFQIDCNAFYVAIDETNNEVIGVCGAPFIRPDTAFLGLYSVRKEYFGRGIGKQLFKWVMKYIGDRNCCLISGPTKVPLYRDRLGFTTEANVKVLVFYGKYETKLNLLDNNRYEIKPIISDQLVDEVIGYDQRIHHYRRETLLKLSLKEPECLAMAALDTNTGRVVGYGCLRPEFKTYVSLRPLYADNDEIAKHLMHSLIHSSDIAVNVGFSYRLLSTNESALRLAEELKHKPLVAASILSLNPIIECDYQKIYSILSSNFSF